MKKKLLIAFVSVVAIAAITVTIVVLVTKKSSPTFLTMKNETYGCPAQTFELKMDPSPHWVGEGSDKRILNVDGEELVCATTQRTIAQRGWFSHFKMDDANLCYHVEKNIRDKDNKLDLSKCVAGPKF